jgi:glyoxylase-like metal-dependent hydrolase (beta-lactamase superfamily II)
LKKNKQGDGDNKMIIESKVVGSLDTLTYIIGCSETREAAIIDPAGSEDKLLWLIKENNLTLKYILLTHSHPDHTSGVKKIKEKTDAIVCLHKEDEELLSLAEFNELLNIWSFEEPFIKADKYITDGEIINLGKLEIKVFHTPGHSPGSVCYYLKGNDNQNSHIFTGDTIFVGAVGNSDLPGGSFEKLIESIKKYIINLPDDTIIHPGHDYGDSQTSTLGKERKENPFFHEFFLAS